MYAATALLLTLDLTRSKHSGVMSTFREHFVKPGIFSGQDSDAYGVAFQLRNTTDYQNVVISPSVFGQARWAETRHIRMPLYRAIEADGIPLTPERIPL